MRVLLACIMLLIAPTAVLIGIKVFEEYRALQSEEQTVDGIAHQPGEVLFFNASWCGPCRQMKPIVTQLRRQGYRLRDVDVDKNRGLAQKYGISGIPTFVFVKNGSEVHRFSGGTSADHLRKLCSSPTYH